MGVTDHTQIILNTKSVVPLRVCASVFLSERSRTPSRAMPVMHVAAAMLIAAVAATATVTAAPQGQWLWTDSALPSGRFCGAARDDTSQGGFFVFFFFYLILLLSYSSSISIFCFVPPLAGLLSSFSRFGEWS